MAFAAGGALPALATGESTISKEVTSGPCLDDPEQQCPRTDVTSLTIANAGFETDDITDGDYNTNAAVWSEGGSAGAFDPLDEDLTGEAPEGQNTGWAAASGSLSQTLTDTYVDGATYSLSLYVCDRSDTDFPGYDVELHDDGGAIAGADETDVDPGDDSCATVTVTHTAGVGSDGEAIQIVLSSKAGSGQTNFDDVALTQSIDVTDVVNTIEKTPSEAYEFDFTITVSNATPDLLVLDTLPAEWIATEVTLDDVTTDINDVDRCGEDNDDVDGVLLEKGGKPGKNCNAATAIEWDPVDSGTTTLKIDAMTRESPGEAHATLAVCEGANKDLFGGKPVSEAKCNARGGTWEGDSGPANVFAPTSCGALYLNDGAVLLLALEGLEPEVLGVSDALCLAVVADSGEDGIDPSGAGDEDGDTLSDYFEACEAEERTDPCNADTDGDLVNDDLDLCPLEGPGTDSDGKYVDIDGCLQWTQCSDGEDNDNDGVTDYAEGDASCDSIEDNTEDTFDDADSDGVGDGFDSCPAEGPANAGLGEILQGNGCIRQSQCSDGVDNADADGFIDDVSVNAGPVGVSPGDADPECSSIIDDDESS